ncbi:hypothetical protein [Flaviflexus huanghaiensis]|uniref:hypothetical protein n=1 Tax=Flaviflexus huanghaiensis TaxID=1111473 RepID=UPI0015FE0201|nr:hypothetical protein [Flaviflexus huanghaiensis]
MNDRVSHRRVRTQPLTTVLLRASTPELVTDIERLSHVAGVDMTAISPDGDSPPAILTLVEESGTSRTVRASFNELFQPEFAGQHVSVNPRTEPADLLELFVAAGATQRGRIVGVIGAHGGAGATVLSVMLARQLAQDGTASLIDMDPLSPGHSILLSLDGSGKRWADIAKESGTLLPGRLVDSLPLWKGVRVLTADERGAAPFTGRSGILAASAVSQVSAVTVIDLPRFALLRLNSSSEWLSWLDHLVIVCSAGITCLATAQRVLPLAPQNLDTTLVISGVKAVGQAEDAGHQLGAEACPLRFERTFDGDIDHGMTPGDRLRSGSARDIRRIATRVLS